jgi:hypothetical protein
VPDSGKSVREDSVRPSTVADREDPSMLKKISFVTGLAVGYTFGAQAGREQYDRIKAMAKKIGPGSEQKAQEKPKQNNRHAQPPAHQDGIPTPAEMAESFPADHQ